MIGIPNPVAYACANCGEPAVLAEFPTGLHPVHCGTYSETCPPPRHARLHARRRGNTVSGPPRSLTAQALRSLRHRLRRLRTC
jgi:hypothetical protein